MAAPFTKTDIPEETDLISHYREVLEGADEGRIYGNTRDPILKKEGFSNAELAFLDPQVKACFLITVFSVMNKQLSWTPPKNLSKKRDIKKSQEMADFINFSLRKLRGADIQLRFDLLTCKFFGYSFVELVYDVIQKGKYKGYYHYSRAKAKRPGLWAFNFDEKGNVNGYKSLLQTNPLNALFNLDFSKQNVNEAAEQKVYPLNQFMSMSWLPLWNNPYGTPDFASIRKFWKAKKEYIVFLLSLGARQSRGKQSILKGDGGISEGNNSEHKTVLKQLNDYLSVYLPKNYDVDFHSFNSKILEDFLAVLRWLDIQIATAMLSNSMTTNQNEKTGSHAMAKAQIETGTFSFTEYACRVMTDVLEEQYARNLFELNYDLDKYPEEIWPECKLIDPEYTDLEKQAKIDEILERLGILDFSTETDLLNRRSLYNLPENPELFEKHEQQKMTATDFISLVEDLEKQSGMNPDISKKLKEILTGESQDPEDESYFNLDNEDADAEEAETEALA